MQPNPIFLKTLIGVSLLSFLPAAIAHGQDADMTMEMGQPSRPIISSTTGSEVAEPLSYFQYTEHTGLMFAHILLMVVAWVFVLPIGTPHKVPLILEHLLTIQVLCYQSRDQNTPSPCNLCS